MKHIDDIRALTELLLGSKNFHSLVIEGAPGWGKSSTVEKILLEKKHPFVTLGSYTTPLRLFGFLSENPKGTLVLDDSAGIFGDAIAMSILKAATWPSSGTEGTRLVTWGSTSERITAQEFFFEGKIILLTNSVPRNGDGAAFASRSLHYCITPSAVEMESLVRSVAKSNVFGDQQIADEVVGFLIERAKQNGFRGVNLRTLQLGYELATSGRSEWKELFGKILPRPDSANVAYLLSTQSQAPVEEQYRQFHRATGLSRRTFFYYRSRNSNSKNPL